MYSDLTPIFPAESSSRPIALITGASRGIGKAIAETFAQAGYDLILTCRQNREKLETLCKSLSEAYSIQAAAFIGDLGDYETVRELFAPIRRLNLLVNNAGISHIGLLTDMSPDQWRRVMSTNLDACFYTCKLAVPLMLHQPLRADFKYLLRLGQCRRFHGNRLLRLQRRSQQSDPRTGKGACAQQYCSKRHCLRRHRHRHEPLFF